MKKVALLCALLLAVPACMSSGTEQVGGGIKFPAKLARDGATTITLEGTTWGTGKVAVVFAHSYPTSMDAWAPFARTIATRGFLALTFNFRGYGLSEGDKNASLADLDLEGAIEKAKALGATRILLVGASMGGTAALVVGSKLALAGVVAVSAPVAFRGLDAAGPVKTLKEPVLLIAAERDPNGAAESAKALHAAAPEPKEIEIVSGSTAHGTELLEGEAADRVANDIAQFLIDHRG